MTEPEEIQALVVRFATFQDALKLTNRAFAARYRKWLGSEKTWKLLRDNQWQGHVRGERILPKLREFAHFIDASASYAPDEFHGKLPFVQSANVEFERLLGAGKDRRCLTILAPEGVGKSWWASNIVSEDPQRRIYLRLSHTWREKSFHIARGISQRLGAAEEKTPAGQMDVLIRRLRERQESVIFLDEGHNGGVAVMRLIKDLIDETPARFVYMAFPTEFDMVRTSSRGAVAEARQFLRRCVRPIFDDYRGGIGARDVFAFLVASGLARNGELKTLAQDLAPILRHNYNLSTLSDAVDDARDRAEDLEEPLSLGMVRDAVLALCSTAQDRRAAEEKEAA